MKSEFDFFINSDVPPEDSLKAVKSPEQEIIAEITNSSDCIKLALNNELKEAIDQAQTAAAEDSTEDFIDQLFFPVFQDNDALEDTTETIDNSNEVVMPENLLISSAKVPENPFKSTFLNAEEQKAAGLENSQHSLEDSSIEEELTSENVTERAGMI